jgi:hypothetical protein
MKLIDPITELEAMPLTFRIDRFDESSANKLLGSVIKKAEEVIGVVSDVFKEDWTNNPSTSVRAVFGQWLVTAVRHFAAVIVLCENHDLSVVADVHHRQIFELFLQTRYFASLDRDSKEKNAEKIVATGYVEFLEKITILKDHDQITNTYKEVLEKLNRFDANLRDEIQRDRKKKSFNWFGTSFSKLAENVSRAGEDLKSAYQIISADIHGTWNLAFDVCNPEPGLLDFRGYPDKTTLYIRATELLYQVTALYMNLWNEIAENVGAQMVYYSDKP